MPSRLAELITSRREDVLEVWEAGVRTLPSGARVSTPALRNQVPAFLDWLAARLEEEAAPDADRDSFSAEHTRERVSQGYELVEIVAEWSLLRDVLLEVWAADPDGVAPADVRRMDVELDHVIAVSVVRWARADRDGETAAVAAPAS